MCNLLSVRSLSFASGNESVDAMKLLCQGLLLSARAKLQSHREGPRACVRSGSAREEEGAGLTVMAVPGCAGQAQGAKGWPQGCA